MADDPRQRYDEADDGDVRPHLRAVEAIDWTKVETQHNEEHYADWYLVDRNVLMYAGAAEDQAIEFLKRAPAAIRRLFVEVEAWRERTETAERLLASARERLDTLIVAGFGATTDTLRELRAALDTKEET